MDVRLSYLAHGQPEVTYSKASETSFLITLKNFLSGYKPAQELVWIARDSNPEPAEQTANQPLYQLEITTQSADAIRRQLQNNQF